MRCQSGRTLSDADVLAIGNAVYEALNLSSGGVRRPSPVPASANKIPADLCEHLKRLRLEAEASRSETDRIVAATNSLAEKLVPTSRSPE